MFKQSCFFFKQKDYEQTLTHTRPTWTHPIPSLAVNHTSSGQEFRGQTLECCCWRTCSHGGRCRSKLGLIRWQQTGKEKRLYLVIRSVQLCVWIVLICVHMLVLFGEKKTVLIKWHIWMLLTLISSPWEIGWEQEGLGVVGEQTPLHLWQSNSE